MNLTIVYPFAGFNLKNAARHPGKHLADAVERKKNKYGDSFPATYLLILTAMSTCGEASSDVHALIKELAIRRVERRSDEHSDESQHLAEVTEVERLWRRFSFAIQQALSFRTRHHLCRRRVTLADSQQLRSHDPMPVQANCTEGRTRSKGQEGANGDGNEVEDREEGGNRNGDGGGNKRSGGNGNQYGKGSENTGKSGHENGSGNEKGEVGKRARVFAISR